ncbi:MAG: DUF2946 domain-containing protein [Paralcaligenes sp.]
MPFTSYRKLGAWLGLLAIWLGLVMPVVSQSVQRPRGSALNLSFCVAGANEEPDSRPFAPTQNQYPSHVLKACGYCGFFATHMPVPQTVTLPADVVNEHRLAAPVLFTAPDLPLAYPPAFARAPPRLSS